MRQVKWRAILRKSLKLPIPFLKELFSTSMHRKQIVFDRSAWPYTNYQYVASSIALCSLKIAKELLKFATSEFDISARSYYKIVKASGTIAGLEGGNDQDKSYIEGN